MLKSLPDDPFTCVERLPGAHLPPTSVLLRRAPPCLALLSAVLHRGNGHSGDPDGEGRIQSRRDRAQRTVKRGDRKCDVGENTEYIGREMAVLAGERERRPACLEV